MLVNLFQDERKEGDIAACVMSSFIWMDEGDIHCTKAGESRHFVGFLSGSFNLDRVNRTLLGRFPACVGQIVRHLIHLNISLVVLKFENLRTGMSLRRAHIQYMSLRR